jgi:hypothetical protein
MDALELLKQDHQNVKKLFKEAEGADGKKQQQLFDRGLRGLIAEPATQGGRIHRIRRDGIRKDACEEVLIPIQCEYYALEGLGQLLRNVELVKSHLNPALEISTIVLTMYDGRTRLASQVADEVRQHFGDLVLKTLVPRSVRVSEAPSYGQSVMTYDPGSTGAVAYMEAAREMAHRAKTGVGN